MSVDLKIVTSMYAVKFIHKSRDGKRKELMNEAQFLLSFIRQFSVSSETFLFQETRKKPDGDHKILGNGRQFLRILWFSSD